MQSVRYSRPILMSSRKKRIELATLLNRMMFPTCCSTVTGQNNRYFLYIGF